MAFLPGTHDNDTLVGSDEADVIFGDIGNDTITGAAGNDFLSGDDGDDDITTGVGDDIVLGGAGNDTIGGMAGRDVVLAGAGDDVITWNDPIGDAVFGGQGNDTIRGGDAAADTIVGGGGDDIIRAFVTSPENATAGDLLLGDHGNELEIGGNELVIGGNDVVIGGNAADTIEGGGGNDFLTGNDGADTFVFRGNLAVDQGFGHATITDFDPSEDVVQLIIGLESFDPLAALRDTPQGAILEVGGGLGGTNSSVLFLGRIAAEFGAEDFLNL
jgi:Ca2+-binding RTX toxin-like protein